MTGGRWAQLFASCLVLAAGVVLLLRAAFGSDGYSTFVTGVSRASGWDFALVNTLVGVVLVGLAWSRGTRPGVGTIVMVHLPREKPQPRLPGLDLGRPLLHPLLQTRVQPVQLARSPARQAGKRKQRRRRPARGQPARSPR